jgi:hypothetical protein
LYLPGILFQNPVLLLFQFTDGLIQAVSIGYGQRLVKGMEQDNIGLGPPGQPQRENQGVTRFPGIISSD